MAFLYPVVSDITGSLNSGSYLNKTDYGLFSKGPESDFWYGTSGADAMEISAYDLNDNLLYWKSIENVGEYKNTILTFYDSKNAPNSYSFRQFIFGRPLYKTEKVLVEPIADLSSSNLPSGEYILSYEFTRYLAGSPSNPLIIKEISPSRTELKLIPSNQSSIQYQAFCVGKIPLDDVSPIYLRLTKNCPYTTIYNNSISDNQEQIDLIKNIFFIPSDGKFVEFLKSIYEDFIKYSRQSSVVAESGSLTFTRIQGIRTYFSNFLVSNTNKVYSFDEIKKEFEKSTTSRLDILFENFKSDYYLSAKKYLFNLFVEDYFSKIHNVLESTYNEKYNSPLKNLLSYGTGQYIPILSTLFIDERESDTDPLTLLIKLQSPINDDISIKSSVWVSNGGMVPVLFNAVIKNEARGKTIKISAPDFTSNFSSVSSTNVNKLYSNNDLDVSQEDNSIVSISKKIGELNVDYSLLSNFIVFSSAELRHTIFKNKMISLSEITSSIANLELAYSSSGYTYPYYTSEKETLQTQESDILNSFDGWDSFLYKTGYYTYNTESKMFSSQSFVDDMDDKVVRYDKFNRDSLVNNTPEHIVIDHDNDDYLIFLSMIGHYFDNLYVYVSSLPTERYGENNNSLARNILQNMLQSFGWKLDTSLESLDINNNYLDKMLGGSDQISAEERTRQIWNRILNTLPIIYKTKGTEECIKIVLSCYGVPSTMIDVKEYGGIDYTNDGRTSYTIEEKLFMLTFKGYREYIELSFYPTNSTLEFKVAIDPNIDYNILQKIPLVVKYGSGGSVDWTIGVYKEKEKNIGRAYFDITTGSTISITSSKIPIFTGDIFNIMLRRNSYSSLFEFASNPDLVPTQYDLRVQRREDGRSIFDSYDSFIFTQSFNVVFGNPGTMYFGNYQNSSSFHGMLDKILVWDVPISDDTFDDHCNNISSYSYTGSNVPHEVLYYRMNFDYPQDISLQNPFTMFNANEYYYSSTVAYAYNFGLQSYSSSVDSCVAVSHSVFPYQFTEIPYNQTFTINSYGPNRFKNDKIRKSELPLMARLDPNERSSYSPNMFITPDSNQIGLFADPNGYKNKDIFRYLGNYGVVGLIADPEEMFLDRYNTLRGVREIYNNSGNKRVLFTELFTLYKFYFDKSVFETIKQLVPARNSVLTGILIEPTVLERPKYQYKRITTEAGVSYTSSIFSYPITSSNDVYSPTLILQNTLPSPAKLKGEFISVDFHTDTNFFVDQLYENVPFFLAEGPYQESDSVYQEYLSLKGQLTYVESGWIKKYPTSAELKNVEQHPDWPIPAADYGPLGPPPGSNFGNSFASGIFKFSGIVPGFYPTASGYFYLNKCYFYNLVNDKSFEVLDNLSKNITSIMNLGDIKLPTFDYNTTDNYDVISDINNPLELEVECDENGKIMEATLSGSSHRYILTQWVKNNFYTTTGDYSKPQTVSSQSIFLKNSQVWLLPEKSNKDLIFNNNFVNRYWAPFNGYSRNHLTHKRLSFSMESKPIITSLTSNFDRYVKGKQTIDTTIGETGLEDASLPVQTVNVSNINVIKTDNVLN